MNSTPALNSDLLSSMIKTKRGKKGLRDTATEIGDISAATLSRIEKGNLPDVETFILICKWLDVPTDTFIKGEKAKAKITEKDMLVYQLRASRELDSDTIDTMVKMIDMAFTKVKRNGKK
jgi:transcriptional regulator with XRE-family HTH domain